jgi:DNA invertase Pin-like site-specific DNA recombinase
VIGYAVVREDASELSSATASIEAFASRVGCRVLEMVHDRRDQSRALDRPGLTYALSSISAGKARGLVVSELMRATRSVVDLAALVRWFVDADATLIALDLGVDTSTPDGRHLATVLSRLGEWERERIVRGTRGGLDLARARGGSVGPPAVKDRPELRERIVELRAEGMTLQAIADVLNDDGVSTLRGGARWRPSSVQVVLGYRRPPRNGFVPQDRGRRGASPGPDPPDDGAGAGGAQLPDGP